MILKLIFTRQYLINPLVNSYKLLTFAVVSKNMSVKKILFKAFLAVAAVAFLSCSTELDINGNKKEVMIVYGILDATTSTQYIKINRAFLGEGNALEYSQIPDSTLYPYLLNVTLDVLNSSGQSVRQYVADTVHIWKDGGVFFTGFQPYYRIKLNDYTTTATGDTVWLSSSYTYKLTIVDPVTGNIYESEAPGISSFVLEKPNPIFSKISFYNDGTKNVEFNSVLNGKMYEVKYVFHYYDVYDSNPNDTIEKTNDWTVGYTTSVTTAGGEDMTVSYSNWDFFYLLGQRLEERDDVTRFPGYLYISVTIGAEDLNTYIDVNQPSSSIIQERPSFSNITNGIGLFSSKYTFRKRFTLDDNTVELLKTGAYTNKLNFVDYWPNFPLH
ncbi:MAG: hypothetical protein A2W93_02340 [Bacteroidetes bacterium GWF2_43_63]|nr:MAG: hypothetical protein A2W94_08345 [Bacteroidetes bacterium GWE2_42_42]OFY53514.1 MAG: hypothetical protein A2W93_02340 [Bacteroidetes bacterium GWF2_43_63]HBG71161.1 hypothetical protein [Bacteroidales bacterium]HCB63739.1 hypothetical protein [Bacteroidales bacterium]HCY24488.1 hypothetical protein [Bacteroidales bacterium]